MGNQTVTVGQARELRSDVVILIPDAGEGRHCSLPGDSGIAAGEAGAEVTASNKHNAIVNALKSVAAGYLQKYSGKEMLMSTVRNAVYRI